MQDKTEANKIIDGIQDSFLTLDREWRFTYLNRGALNIVHQEAANLIGKVLWNEFPELVGTDLENAFRRAMEYDVIQRVEIRGIRSGNIYNFIAIPMPEGLAVYCQDIAEQKRLVEELVFQAHLLDSVHDAIFAMDEKYIVTYWNDMAEKIFGYSAAEVLGKPSPIQASITGSSRNQEIAKMINEGFYVGEAIYNHKNGMPVYTIVHARVLKDSQGAYKGNVASFRDITERKKMEEALKHSEAMLRTVLKNSSDGINMLDLKTGQLVFMNQAQVELTGFSQEEINILSAAGEAYKRVHPEDREVAAQYNKLAAADLSAYHALEYRWKIKSGEYRWFSDRSRLVRDEEGKQRYLVRSSRDITERKQAEKELQESQKQALELVEKLSRADSNKNEFISVLSHELRNPLASIMMGITVFDQAAPGSEEDRQAREIIRRQTGHLSHLVDELLEVTRITQNKITLKKERLELNQLVEQAVQDYRPQFAEKKVGLEVKLNASPVYLEADPARLTQAVGNLLANASRSTDTGGNTLVTVETDQASKEAVIKIKDTGMGIDPSLLSDLFEPFMQADRSPGRSHSGLGMGLSIVKGIAILHGGSAAAFSEGRGRGTQFTIRLPLASQEAQDIQATEEPVLEEQSCTLRILVIDDMPSITNFMNILLKKLGHEVIIANNGPEGIAKAREFKPELILCDIGMPGMDGYDVAREIRCDDRLKDIFLIALSGYVQPEDLKNSKDAGFDRHLAKPVRMAVLKATLDEYCHEKLG